MSEAHGREEEREASSFLLHKEAHSPPRAEMSSPVPFLLPSLISPLHSNFSVLRLRKKRRYIQGRRRFPCPACFLIFPFSEKGTDNRGKHKEQESLSKLDNNKEKKEEATSRMYKKNTRKE